LTGTLAFRGLVAPGVRSVVYTSLSMKTSKKLDEEASPINIPQAKRTWPLEQIPLSARLERVLRELGCQKLGDLDGLTFHQVAGVRSCGVATLRELR
jgi:hypothetical protein